VVEHGFGGADVAGEEGAELGVAGAGFVEAHTVDDVFEVLGVGCPEGDTPFPIVEAEADADELADLACEGHAAAGMFAHQGVAFLFGEHEPVFADFAFFVHGVEAGVGPLGEGGCEPLAIHADKAFGVAFDFLCVRRAIGGFAFGNQTLAKLFDAGDVFADLGHRDKRIAGDERDAERAGHEALVDAVDLQGVGVHEHEAEVGFVAADGGGLQAEGGIVAGGIKCRDYVGSAGGDLLRRQTGECAAVPGVVEMAAVPTALGGGKRNFDRLVGWSGSVSGAIHSGYGLIPKGKVGN